MFLRIRKRSCLACEPHHSVAAHCIECPAYLKVILKNYFKVIAKMGCVQKFAPECELKYFENWLDHVLKTLLGSKGA